MDWTRGVPAAPKSMLCHPLPKPRNAAPCSETCMVVSPTAAPGRALCATQSPSLRSSSACLTPAHVGDAASQVAPSGRGGICAQNSEMSSFWQPAAWSAAAALPQHAEHSKTLLERVGPQLASRARAQAVPRGDGVAAAAAVVASISATRIVAPRAPSPPTSPPFRVVLTGLRCLAGRGAEGQGGGRGCTRPESSYS